MFELHEKMVAESIAKLQGFIDNTVETEASIFEIMLVVLYYTLEKMILEFRDQEGGPDIIASEEVIRIIALALRKLSDEINAVITN